MRSHSQIANSRTPGRGVWSALQLGPARLPTVLLLLPRSEAPAIGLFDSLKDLVDGLLPEGVRMKLGSLTSEEFELRGDEEYL